LFKLKKKEKTKTFNRNALNPIWNEEFAFHVVFPDLAFVKFAVVDSANNHVIAQRVVPLKRLLRGYRHLRLRNNQNQLLELSTLFMHTRQQVEHVQQVAAAQSNLSSSGVYSSSTDITSTGGFGPLFGGAAGGAASHKIKHKQFKLTVYGLSGAGAAALVDDEEVCDTSYSNLSALGSGVQVKVTQETTVYQVIEQVCLFLSFF
jgi:Ca2+-dependent lipid-binding protein